MPNDIEQQISLTLGDHTDDFNIPAIAAELVRTYGRLTNIDDIPGPEYWAIVRKHDSEES